MTETLSQQTLDLLAADLDRGRVKKHPHRRVDYLPEHDVVRTANRIFGFGRWGYDIIDLVCIGAAPVKRDNREGLHVGYRCTIRLTVAGCVPVCGVGYGDATEYTQTAAVTAHELAVKEAESDAKKRAFKNFGDQFGLILYAKTEDERAKIEAEKHTSDPTSQPVHQNIDETFVSENEVAKLLDLAAQISPQARGWVDGTLKKHREANGGRVTRTFLANGTKLVNEKLEAAKASSAGGTFTPPASVQAELAAREGETTASDVERAFAA